MSNYRTIQLKGYHNQYLLEYEKIKTYCKVADLQLEQLENPQIDRKLKISTSATLNPQRKRNFLPKRKERLIQF